ncbi:MAG: Serine/threonine-protein kinase PknD [Phycisphaerae bacterium]|nr:Serine/threonine-protein kinase PknD [Phycisphaerae bacterium]
MSINEPSINPPPSGASERAPFDATGSGVNRPGQVIGEFELREMIGRGGMGTVYKAWQQSLRRLVAVKVLAPHIAGSRGNVVRFQREAQAAAKLHHPNIVPIFALGEDQGIYYYAMELIEGRGLHEIIREERQRAGLEAPEEDLDATRILNRTGSGATPAPKARELSAEDTAVMLAGSGAWSAAADRFEVIAAQLSRIADALAYAHDQGVIHRDIKPHNLMLSRDGRLLLTDFGLARIIEQPGITMTSEVVGSPLYMAPEQISGDGTMTARSDIYSLGATLYEWMTLHPPFSGRTRETVITQILTGDVRAPRLVNERIPGDLETICLKSLERDPSRRYATAHEFRDDLNAYLSRGRIKARRAGAVERGRRFLGRHKIGVVAAAVLLIVACGAYVIVRQRDTIRRIQRDGTLVDGGDRIERPVVTAADPSDPPPGPPPRPGPGREAGGPQSPPGNRPRPGARPGDPVSAMLARLFPAESLVFGAGREIVERNAPSIVSQAEGITGSVANLLTMNVQAGDLGTLDGLSRLAAADVFTQAGPLNDLVLVFDPLEPDPKLDVLIRALEDDAAPQRHLELVTLLIDGDPNNDAARYVRALLYGRTEQFDRMETDASEFIQRHLQDAHAYLLRAVARLMAGRAESAREDIAEALELDPQIDLGRTLRGIVDLHLGDTGAAVASFDEALQRRPDAVLAMLGRAMARMMRSEPSAAIADLDRVLELFPDNVSALVMRGNCATELGDHARAREDYGKAILIAGQSPALMSKLLSAMAAEQGNLARQQEQARRSSEGVPADRTGSTPVEGAATPQDRAATERPGASLRPNELGAAPAAPPGMRLGYPRQP